MVAKQDECDILRAVGGRARDKGPEEVAQVIGRPVDEVRPLLDHLIARGEIRRRGPAGYDDPRQWTAFLTLTPKGEALLRDCDA